MAIYFHTEDTDFNYKEKRKGKKWIKNVINSRDFKVGNLNIIFSSDTYLLKINQDYLNHNHFTDVITFDYSDKGIISGDIFISIDKVLDNSSKFGDSFMTELNRVIIHGVLHLLGYNDKDETEKGIMRKMEDDVLHLWDKTE